MIRSFLLSLLVFVVLVGAFALYWLNQPRVAVQGGGAKMAKVPTTAPVGPTAMQIGTGNGAWVNSYDHTGRLVSQFNADEYTPTGGNEFAVTKPVCVFYMVGGQTVVLRGDSGVVYVDPGKKSGGGFAVANASSPNRGRLKNVHIDLYPPAANRPTQWMDTDNIAFDNDTLRIFTESFTDAAGSTVPADQVPVHVRGDEYEFDGQGLVLRWNDRDARVQLLEIAHGDRLLVKDTKKVSTPFSTAEPSPSAKEPPPPTGTEAAAAAGKPLPAVVQTPHPAVPPVAPHGPTLYRAEFERNVRIFQDGKLTGTGDTLTTLFLTGHAPAPVTQSTVMTTTKPSPATVASTSPATTAATRPTTAPAAATAVVLWTGKLRVTPVEVGTLPLPPAVGSTVVRLDGAPALLAPAGATLSAASVTYRTGDGAAIIEPSADVPVVHFTDAHGVKFNGRRVVYNPVTAIATLSGPASLVQPVEGEPNQFLTAHWAGEGLLHVVPHGGQPDFVDHVDLQQNVVVAHPQFHLTSDDLTLALSRGPRASTTTAPATHVDRAVATGRAVAIISRAGDPKREIDGDRLTMILQPDAAGKSAPREVLADGHVHAFDPTQNLTAGHLDALLAPKPADEDTDDDDTGLAIQTVHATDAVHVELHNGTRADADELWLTTPNGHNQIDLHGTPVATVSDAKQSVLSGAHIRLLPDDSIVRVLGPGTLDTVRVSDKGEPPKKIDVTWTRELDVNGNANTVDAYGSVTATSKRPDGTVDTLVGDHAHANLVDTPPTPRPTIAAATKLPGSLGDTKKHAATTTSPAEQIASGKTVKDMQVTGNDVLTSILLGPDEKLLRQEKLVCDMLTYDVATGVAVIPGPGKLFSQDQRPPSTQPATASASAAAPNDGVGGRGITAVAWKKDAVYTRDAHTIVLRGDTLVAFSKTPQQKVPMRLASQTLTIDLATPNTTPAGAPKPPDAGVQISHVRAVTAVRFTSVDLDFVGHQVDYDPPAGLMTVTGNDAEPAEVQRGTTTGRFRSLLYDVKNEVIKNVDGLNAGTP